MVGFKELSKMSTFTMSDVYMLVGNKKTASSLVFRLIKKGLVKKIRNDLYSCINLADGSILASRYQIACGINDSAYISYHSAFEYQGMANQVFYEVYVSSKQRFKSFVFEGITYNYVSAKNDVGVVEPKHSEGIKVTVLERTVIDSIRDLGKAGGLEELLNCISMIVLLDENLLVSFLDMYNINFLYQKTGFILGLYKDELKLSDSFIGYCKSKIGNSSRYLTDDSEVYDHEWRLVIPLDMMTKFELGET